MLLQKISRSDRRRIIVENIRNANQKRDNANIEAARSSTRKGSRNGDLPMSFPPSHSPPFSRRQIERASIVDSLP